MDKTRKAMLPKLHAAASVQPTTLDENARTVSVVWSTGYRGLRKTPFGDFFEELDMSPQAVDLSRMKNAPLLDSHDGSTVENVIGTVERASVENGQGIAVVRFASDPKSQATFEKVRDGILKQISVGYRINAMKDVTGPKDETPTYRVTSFTPMELSVVSVAFDPYAQVRSNENSNSELNEAVIERQEADMKEQKEVEQKKTDRQRAADIRKEVRAAGFDSEFADDLIDSDVTVEQARENIAQVAKYVKKTEDTRIDNTVRVEVGSSDRDKKRDGLVDSIACRLDRTYKPKDVHAKRIFDGRTIIGSVEQYLGRQLGETDFNLAKRAMSTSDFPLILAASAERAMQNRYQLAPRSFSQWVRNDTLRNYKEASRLRAGSFPSLLERKEDAEYKYGSFSEQEELVQLADYGIVISFSSQALVNDDIKGLAQVASEGAVAASRLENRLVYAQLTSNPDMGDGTDLFHADHANLGTGAAISDTTIGEAFKLMREQSSVDGLDKLNLAPKYMICGPQSEMLARKYIAMINPTASSAVNPWAGMLQLVVDAEISTNDYFFAADQNSIDTVVLYHLEGREQPRIESRINWENDSFELKVAHAAVAKAMDWRGLVKNANAS